MILVLITVNGSTVSGEENHDANELDRGESQPVSVLIFSSALSPHDILFRL